MNTFVIQCISNHELLWSNTDGWTDCDNFDVFTIEESETLNLPIDGQWVRSSEIVVY